MNPFIYTDLNNPYEFYNELYQTLRLGSKYEDIKEYIPDSYKYGANVMVKKEGYPKRSINTKLIDVIISTTETYEDLVLNGRKRLYKEFSKMYPPEYVYDLLKDIDEYIYWSYKDYPKDFNEIRGITSNFKEALDLYSKILVPKYMIRTRILKALRNEVELD